MGLEDELQRILRDDRLDIPVRTGAEWSLVASARRRRQRNGVLAVTGSALATMLLVGGGIALVSQQSDQPVQPAVPPVVQPVPHPFSTITLVPSAQPPAPQVGQPPPAQGYEPPSTPGMPTRRPIPTTVETMKPEPDPTTAKPPVTTSADQSSTQTPAATEPDSPGQ